MQLDSVDATTLAEVLGMTPRRVQQLARGGVIPKAARGRYDLPACVQAWGSWLTSGKAAGDVSAEKKKLLSAQARIKTIEAQKAEGAVLPVEDVQIVFNTAAVEYVRAIEALPGRFAGALPGKDAAQIKQHVAGEVHAIRVSISEKFRSLAALGKQPAKSRKPATKPRRRSRRDDDQP